MRHCPKCGRDLDDNEFYVKRQYYKTRSQGNTTGKTGVKRVGFQLYCKTCFKDIITARYRANRQHVREVQNRRRRAMKYEVLIHYSKDPPECACCGEWLLPFLSIDHIEGGGTKHRKNLGGKYSVADLYRWLKDQGYPAGFRVLCYNCNIGRAHNLGICPHETMTKDSRNRKNINIKQAWTPDMKENARRRASLRSRDARGKLLRTLEIKEVTRAAAASRGCHCTGWAACRS